MSPSARAWQVSVQHGVAYELVKCAGLFDPHNPSLLALGRGRGSRRLIVVDENVHDLHGAAMHAYFSANGVEARIVRLPAGESNKTLDAYLGLVTALDDFPIDRRDEPIIAIGGGVTTDLTGFVAGTYRRGVPHVRVPTTLMGYVDASVGIKTGVNFRGHKNRLGVFFPPARVLLDRSFLRTLPDRHILNGVCEILKLAVICDLQLFELLEVHGLSCIETRFQDEVGMTILDQAIQRTLDELTTNLFEADLCRALDFGHSFAYGLETCAGSTYLHGEAVLIDVLLSSHLARARGLLSANELDRIERLAVHLGLIPPMIPLDSRVLWESLTERTLHRDGHQRIPLPSGIGSCTFFDDVEECELERSSAKLMRYGEVRPA